MVILNNLFLQNAIIVTKMGLLMGIDVVKFMDIVHVMKVGKDTSACSVSKQD